MENENPIIQDIRIDLLNLIEKFKGLSEKEIQYLFSFFRYEFDFAMSKVISTEQILEKL
jgi:hypothetical protein